MDIDHHDQFSTVLTRHRLVKLSVISAIILVAIGFAAFVTIGSSTNSGKMIYKWNAIGSSIGPPCNAEVCYMNLIYDPATSQLLALAMPIPGNSSAHSGLSTKGFYTYLWTGKAWTTPQFYPAFLSYSYGNHPFYYPPYRHLYIAFTSLSKSASVLEWTGHSWVLIADRPFCGTSIHPAFCPLNTSSFTPGITTGMVSFIWRPSAKRLVEVGVFGVPFVTPPSETSVGSFLDNVAFDPATNQFIVIDLCNCGSRGTEIVDSKNKPHYITLPSGFIPMRSKPLPHGWLGVRKNPALGYDPAIRSVVLLIASNAPQKYGKVSFLWNGRTWETLNAENGYAASKDVISNGVYDPVTNQFVVLGKTHTWELRAYGVSRG